MPLLKKFAKLQFSSTQETVGTLLKPCFYNIKEEAMFPEFICAYAMMYRSQRQIFQKAIKHFASKLIISIRLFVKTK